MMEDKKIVMESLQDRESICKYLQVLKQGFEQGQINFSDHENKIMLEPHGLIKFEIKSKIKDGEVKLSLRFRWEEKEDDKNENESPLENSEDSREN
ncbi:MAG: amphi-Trp domain-containing protein [Desulfonatronovibrio sp.]|nr:amphi-Trp domain-containing protein [Desulfovibrionales bacterium]